MEDNKTKDEVKKSAEGKADNSSEAVVNEAAAAVRGSGASSLGSEEELKETTVEKLEKSISSGENNSKKSSSRGVNTKKKRNSKKTKKWIRNLIIVAILGLAIFVFVRYQSYKALNTVNSADSGTEIASIEKMDLASTISTTGTIQSKDVRTLTSALSGVTINEVNYEVGDMVEEGAVVVSFSREDINKKIQDLEEDIAEAQASAALTAEYKAREHEYDYGTAAYNNYTAGVKTEDAQISLEQAQRDLNEACSDKSEYVDKYNNAKDTKTSATNELEEVQFYYGIWKQHNGEGSTNEIQYYPDDLGSRYWYYYNNYKDQDTWTKKISELESTISSCNSIINSYDTQIASYESTIERAQDTLLSAQRNVTSAQASQSETNRQTSNNVYTSDYNYAKDTLTANDNINNLQRQMEEYEEKLDDYIVYAPISGLVTQVNAQEGNGYVSSSGALMTIQAIDVFEITTQIDEYDINSVVEGQRVVIKTDATGDDELEGVVSFISPTATASTSGNTYEVDIDITTKDSRLKLGMSAKINIIVESHSGILAVRYDALEEDSNGDSYVYVVDEKEAFGNMPQMPGSDEGSVSDDAIVVSGFDGSEKVTGVPDMSDFSGGQRPSAPGGSQSFISYLFGGAKDQQAGPSSSLSTATKKVYVTVGIEGDYYTEISSNEISEGTKVTVKSKSDSSNGFSMFGGGMDIGVSGPSGGDRPSGGGPSGGGPGM